MTRQSWENELFGDLKDVTNQAEFQRKISVTTDEILDETLRRTKEGSLKWERTAKGLRGEAEVQAIITRTVSANSEVSTLLILYVGSVEESSNFYLRFGDRNSPICRNDHDVRVKELGEKVFGMTL